MSGITRGNCEVCGEPVYELETAAYPITGWVVDRKVGGANQVVDKKVIPGQIAHAVCVKSRAKKRRSGVADSQLKF